MDPSSAAASARFKLVFVASFGLITGACAFIGYYLVRRYRKSSDVNTAGCLSSQTKTDRKADEKTPNDKEEDTGESKNAEIFSNDAAKESHESEAHEAEVDSRDLRPENKDIDTKYQDSVAESNKLDASVTGIERDARRDATSSSHTSNENDTQCRGVERPTNGDTLPGKRKVFSAGITHFLDETNGDLSSSDFAKGAQQLQRQDSWSETVIVDSGKESDKLLCELQVNGLQADRTEEDIETREKQRKQKADIQVTPHTEALNEKTQFSDFNDGSNNFGTSDRQNGESKISEVENSSGDQPVKSGKSGEAAVAASSTQESTSQDDVNKEHGARHQQLTTDSNVTTPTTKSALPLPLTPPPPSDGGPSRRQRGGTRGGQTASKQTRGAGSQSARSGRRRWSPLEDKTTAENVELDAGSQQASWKSSRPSSGGAQSGARSPWTGVTEADIAPAAKVDPAGMVEFDDNFVVDAAARKGFGDVSSNTPAERRPQQPGVTRRSSGGPAKEIGCLVEAPSECVLERKPLISENEEDDEEDDDDDDGHIFSDHQRSKSTKEEGGVPTENVASVSDLSISNAEGRKKLVHIDENCVDSLIQLLAKESAEDTAVRLASLRALVNLSWTTEKHGAYAPVIDRLFAIVDGQDARLRFESLRVLANLSKNPDMVSYLLAAKAPGCLLKMLTPELDEEVLTLWLGVLDDILWTSKELCLTYASLPSDRRAASPETVYTGLYGLKNSRILKSRIFILSRHRSQQVTYLASHIYSCLTS